ncbi:MAG: hypothetical protein A6F70_02540 [Cycloclasticus sp. symbiont of Bathymodiolus heckerae]|nr:MAG: hypothetical protein A6F70_02540 [Cycloclasticus sp. symbiont of Bathymodiolus heckerae]
MNQPFKNSTYLVACLLGALSLNAHSSACEYGEVTVIPTISNTLDSLSGLGSIPLGSGGLSSDVIQIVQVTSPYLLPGGDAPISLVGGGSSGLLGGDSAFAVLPPSLTSSEACNNIGSLAATSTALSGSVRSVNTMVNGAHSRPLSRQVDIGEKTMWLAGDWGENRHHGRDDSIGMAEIGVGYNYGWAQINLSYGKTWTNQSFQLSSYADSDGDYLMLESIVPLSFYKGAFLTIGSYGHWGEVDMRRGYIGQTIILPATVVETLTASTSNADTRTWGLRARLDIEDAYSYGNTSFSPYIDASYTETKVDGYTEDGGLGPMTFDSRREEVSELRVGLNSMTPIHNSGLSWIGNIEGVYRFEGKASAVTGGVVGIYEFDLDGQQYDDAWLKAGIGIEGQLADGKASLMLNGTTEGEAMSTWIAASYQFEF